jgi:glutaminyl-peptide cyclotransferase
MKRLAALLLVLVAPLGAQPPAAETPIQLEVAVPVQRFPHDPQAFTQGLFIDRGELFESTGMMGRSSVRRVDLASGKVLKSVTVQPPYFGEGIAPWQGQVLSLTWQNGTGFRWDRVSLKRLGSFRYKGEGWGLTSTGRELVMSDGSDVLRFVDPKDFATRRTVKVTVQGRPLRMLNELEWVNGQVLANVWMTDFAVRIDPASGKVVGVIDLSRIHREAGVTGYSQVANGIAFDARTGKLYMTGKEWPALFEVRLERVRTSG